MKIVINLSPSDVRKRGSNFDLSMAVALSTESIIKNKIVVKKINSNIMKIKIKLNMFGYFLRYVNYI